MFCPSETTRSHPIGEVVFASALRLKHGWVLDNELYAYRYWNKQNYNNPSIQSDGFFAPGPKPITAISAVDKLNGYRKVGDITSVSHEWARGILRTGPWFEWAYTDR